MKIIDRIKRVENAIKQKIEKMIVDDSDGFITAVVGEENVERYKDSNGGFDFMKALNDTAKDDWRDYDDLS